MATVAEFTIPSQGLPLGSIFERHPEVSVELERVIPTGRGIVPYIWVRGIPESDEGTIRAAFLTRPDVRDVELVDKVEGEHLLRVEWRPEYRGILQAIVEAEVVLLSGVGTGEEWTIEVRADERDAIATFQQYCRDNDLPVTLRQLRTLFRLPAENEHGLTEPQREALVLAYERGYYESPRTVTLEEMADELGITGQSLGARLRRGINRLVGSTLVDPSGSRLGKIV